LFRGTIAIQKKAIPIHRQWNICLSQVVVAMVISGTTIVGFCGFVVLLAEDTGREQWILGDVKCSPIQMSPNVAIKRVVFR
jgi:hypothetical protein